MSKLSDKVPIPPKDLMNTNLSSATEATMLKKFGSPGTPKPGCGPASAAMKPRLVTANVGPFKVTGLVFAVESLKQIFAEVQTKHPDVFKAVKTAGMWCVRHRNHNSSKLSNHSWGTTIDLFFGTAVVDQGVHLTHRGMLPLFPIFNKHGWYWGAEFSGDSVDSMHFELSEETILKLEL
ncbi:M15 family metallopeptidase [Longimicrobium sp.]|uniref:M15 family metallopeptidase n=1 Tax=Longimicrobium sp. TaxID=2029185 RepID=UPI002C8CA677|nr:M15 family metallopeptidase [Longimicrobium sp.]HSU16551.1 M15 family metallopeptidase [Longimicrobium sp.]